METITKNAEYPITIKTVKKKKIVIKCPNDVISGHLITKELRHELHGTVAGGGGSMNPEIYQRSKIVEGTGLACSPTIVRINKRTRQMHEIAHPMTYDNGFDYTENFDGMQLFEEKTIWINLKSVVGKGGSQTRTLRDECYPFIDAQLNYLLTANLTTCFFANIFDGEEAHTRMPMFNYLLNLPQFENVKKYVYVGDLKNYFDWLKSNI
jgi:hypothetical protein